MTRNVRFKTLRPSFGARRMPASAASMVPRAQLRADTRDGRPPFKAVRLRSSTTARMAIPMRVRKSRRRRKMATRPAVAISMSSCQLMLTLKIRTLWPAKNSGRARGSVCGNRHRASPTRNSSRPRVTIRATPVSEPRTLRISTRSTIAPNSGARMNSTAMSANGAGQCMCTRSCQYRKARSMPMAPWAKLKIPDVV